ncbi:MAG: biotin/lipoyl-containing protein [Terriglobales bacterium]
MAITDPAGAMTAGRGADAAASHSFAVELNLAADPPRIIVDGEPVAADLRRVDARTVSVLMAGRAFTFYLDAAEAGGLRLSAAGMSATATVTDPRRQRREAAPEEGKLRLNAPMAGRVVRWLAHPGDALAAGQGVLVLEAMKMQNEVTSPKAGRLVACLAPAGQAVGPGSPLAEIE